MFGATRKVIEADIHLGTNQICKSNDVNSTLSLKCKSTSKGHNRNYIIKNIIGLHCTALRC